MTTLHASSAVATAAYYARYLTAAPGEVPGVWSGRQASGLGLSGTVDVEALELLLAGRDPGVGTPLGRELRDRYTADGRLVRAVSGFDATFSAPKSLSVWWALTGDARLLEAHDVAVAATLEHLERFGSTTRIRRDGGRLHPETHGLTVATFRQTTSRADDPQVHSHAVISAKVQTADGRWLALDARYLKRHQRMLGGLYQSVLRSELTHRFGAACGPIVNGQAEIAGFPAELLAVFSKRSADIDAAMANKLDEFRQRQGRDPTRWERAALSREASADTRSRKSGHGAADLAARWQAEAAEVGWTAPLLTVEIDAAGRDSVGRRAPTVTVAEVIDGLSVNGSTWTRADVLRTICDAQRPASQMTGDRWLSVLEVAADRVLEHCVGLDPVDCLTSGRVSDGRSLWIEPTAPGFTSEAVLAQEEQILTWAMDAQAGPRTPSDTVDRQGLDVLQADAAAAVAGHDRLVLVIGPAGAGKTRMLQRAHEALRGDGPAVFGLAPTAKAARVLERDTAMVSDTVAKLLYEWSRPDRPPHDRWRLAAGTTVVVDEAGMIGTPSLHQLVGLAERQRWRLALVGDPRQLQAVGRGGLFHELCATGRVEPLQQIHRFTHRWEASASLLLRAGDPRALDAYAAHGRIIAGTLDDHLALIADTWIDRHARGHTTAMVASTNEHVEAINAAVQAARIAAGHLDAERSVDIGGGERAHVGDVIATRRNERRLITTAGEPVRNRETWTITAVHDDGSLTVTHQRGHGTVTLPADYVEEHVRLGYAATEHGYQSDTVTAAIELASAATTRRGLYVAVTRGRVENLICVITDTDDVAEARDVLDAILAVDRADIPAVTQRRTLAAHVEHPRRPAPRESEAARCRIPDWFPELLANTRHDVAAAEQAAEANAVERARREAAVAAAQRQRTVIERETAPHRLALGVDTKRADQARRAHAAAQRHLQSGGRRRSRPARRELEIAEHMVDRANARLERTQQRTAPHVERYRAAVSDLEEARTHVQHHDLGTALDGVDRLPGSRRTVAALDAWQRWAHGDTIDIGQLRSAVAVLSHAAASESHRALGRAIQSWADTAGIELPIASRQPTRPASWHPAALEPAGPVLGLQ